MTRFRYRALTPAGETVSGVVDAESQAEAVDRVRKLGHYPISAAARPDGWRRFVPDGRPLDKPASTRELAAATGELATLLEAGLELDRALAMLIGLDEVARLRPALAAVHARVRDGASLASALEAEAVFPKLYVNMVRAGELAGHLAPTLHRLADYLARTQALRDSLHSALVYPTILLVTAALSVALILLFVLPQFEPLFEASNKPLPGLTRLMIGAGNVLARFWWLFAGAFLAGWLALRAALRNDELRLRRDRLVLRAPWLGELLGKIEIERICRTLGTLLQQGMALPAALAIVREVASNRVFADALDATAKSLREGERLSAQLKRTGAFPALTIDLIRVGEEAGQLEQMLLKQADLYERSVTHAMHRLLALLTPALTIGLGALIALLLGSMLLAIVSVNDLAL